MLDPVFHVGYHRTSTTWFQDVFYPRVVDAVALPRTLLRKTLIEPRAFEFDAAAARNALLAAGNGMRLIACEENLSGYLHNGGLGGLVSKEMADRIHATFPEGRIVVFLRSQPEIVTASYAQYVRGGGTADLCGYVEAQSRAKGAAKYWYKAPMFALQHFRYGPLLAHYRSLFGTENVHVRLYESFREEGRVFLQGLVRDLSLTVDLADVPLERVNASLTPRAISILRRLNLFTGRSVQNKQVLLDWNNWYDMRWQALRALAFLSRTGATTGHVSLPPEVRQAIYDCCAEDNARVAAEWNLPLADFGYPLP